MKVSIALEELGLPYEPHLVDIGKNESWTPEFLSLNPNGKIPAIIDPDGPGGKPIGLFESGAILLYLAEKTGKLMPADPARRYETIQWVFFQMASIGPMFGQVGFFHKFAGREIADKRPLERYRDESRRLLGVLETQAEGPQMDHGRRLHHRRHLDARLGAQPDRLLRGARTRRLRRFSRPSRHGWSAAWRGRRCNAASPSRRRPEAYGQPWPACAGYFALALALEPPLPMTEAASEAAPLAVATTAPAATLRLTVRMAAAGLPLAAGFLAWRVLARLSPLRPARPFSALPCRKPALHPWSARRSPGRRRPSPELPCAY